MNQEYDIIVVGGGHAGVEAALAASRMGRTVVLVTMDRTKLALMSCNPAVGGIGKSHIVKEIDALGGVMGIAADATGIQFRRLNLSRGPAVWSTRVQSDRAAYNKFVCDYVDNQSNLTVIEGLAEELIIRDSSICGVICQSGLEIASHAVILATGTFLGGTIHIGEKQIEAGRMGEPAATRMSLSLTENGFELGRLKTGTPPRIDGNTIDYSICTIQPGDIPIPFFSHSTTRKVFEQAPCHLTYTTDKTKQLVVAQSHRSPIFSGTINSRGPRYCPSIEDKFVRFADKDRHQIFLEPEGNGTSEIYPNGFSTALPEEVQRDAIRTITGLEEAVITTPGYAIEYDYCPTHQIKPSLETRIVSGLYFAGQINGTSGYEEAAAQGLMAGVNASLFIDNEEPFVLDRATAYIGVMIDDLCTRSTTEPYRMFTSRAEYRLTLREDNARDRMSEYAARYGLVNKDELDLFATIRKATDSAMVRYRKIRVNISDLGAIGDRFEKMEFTSLENLLRQPHVDLTMGQELIMRYDPDSLDSPEVIERAIIQVKYSGYIDKQQREIDNFKRMESMVIPENFNYEGMRGLKREAHEKFAKYRPGSLGQAGRIEGVSPGDIAVLSVYLKRAQGSE